MFVILTKDVPGVGQKNGLKNVSKGYFMNFLQPRKLAQIATPKKMESLKETILAQKAADTMAAQELQEKANALGRITLSFSGKASTKGTLFKAIGEKDVIAALKKQTGLELKKDDIEMEHLKKAGDHTVVVKIGTQRITVKVKLEAKES